MTAELTPDRPSFKASCVVTGGTGYMGRALIPALIARGHAVTAVARSGSESRVPSGARVVTANALASSELTRALNQGDTLVHLIGTPHPGPGKGAEFQSIDLVSIQSAVAAATNAGASHLVYLSVAQPAPIMKEYQMVRAEGERLAADAKLSATFLRPWYVLGPGHWWPVALTPMYALASLIPGMREGARRTGLVTLSQMVRALVYAVENPPPAQHQRIIDVPGIQNAATQATKRPLTAS